MHGLKNDEEKKKQPRLAPVASVTRHHLFRDLNCELDSVMQSSDGASPLVHVVPHSSGTFLQGGGLLADLDTAKEQVTIFDVSVPDEPFSRTIMKISRIRIISTLKMQISLLHLYFNVGFNLFWFLFS